MPAMIKDTGEYWSADRKLKYENAMALLLMKIEKIDSGFAKKTKKSMFRYKEKRLKSPDSIEEKLKRKGKNKNAMNVEEIINDLAGVRIVCFDSKQVYQLAEEIKKEKELKILKEKDYILHPKENGYQSDHMIIGINDVKVELQIRTILMDAWSSLETILIYKKKDRQPKDVMEKIRKFSKWSSKMDQMIEEMIEQKG